MTRREPSPTDPREWLRRARSNLRRARRDVDLRGILLEDLCFDTQQAAEKAIKAVFLRRDEPFPYTHDLAGLISRLLASGEAVPEEVKEAGRLTRYAIVTRYPGLAKRVTKKEYAQALAIAEAVVRWATRRVAPRSRKKQR